MAPGPEINESPPHGRLSVALERENRYAVASLGRSHVYRPAHFIESSTDAMCELMTRWPLGLFITNQSSGLAADPIPLNFVRQGDEITHLIGHIAKANPISKLPSGSDVLVVFSGPNHYVSPNSYPSKKANPKVVPTWNYASVQIGGRIEFVTEPRAVLEIVTSLTDQHERHQEHPWRVSDAPSDYVDQMLNAIIGIRVLVSTIDAKFKASQNRSAEDREGVRSARNQSSEKGLAHWTIREPKAT